MTSRDARLVGLFTLVALALRLGFVLAVRRHSFVLNDSFFYGLTAKSLAEGKGFEFVPGYPTAHWPPGYPFVLSLLYRVFGSSEKAGEILNAFIGALTVPLLYELARRAFGRREALVAAGFLAVFPGQILWADVLVAETFYTFMLVGFLLLLAVLPPRLWGWLLLGAGIGAITLTRGEGLLLIPVVIAVWWPGLPRKALLARAAAVVAAALLVLAPWTIRNAIVMDAFIPLATNSSTTLWSGHNPTANGGQSYAGHELTKQITGKQPEVEEARILRKAAFKFMRTHPKRELELIPLKLLNLNRGDSWAMEWVNAGKPGRRPFGKELGTPVRVVADVGYYGLLALTLAALVLFWRALWRRPITRGVLTLFAGSLVMYGFVYYGNYRYRVPLEPLMMLVAAPLLVRAWDLRRAEAT
ncbi:MAG: ArnT family glycosyltransferase [Thermoleophilaceae bacterium]|jgi:4-amino-4-deoxy-L-arabinose transferase-like glycosyltransferase